MVKNSAAAMSAVSILIAVVTVCFLCIVAVPVMAVMKCLQVARGLIVGGRTRYKAATHFLSKRHTLWLDWNPQDNYSFGGWMNGDGQSDLAMMDSTAKHGGHVPFSGNRKNW